MRCVHSSVAIGLLVLLAGEAIAAPLTYVGKGPGNKLGELAPRAGNKNIGTSRCAANEITIDVTVDGASVRGSFREKHGGTYRFEATRDVKGAFNVDIPRNRESGASSGGPSHAGLDDSLIHVRGVINDGDAQITVEDSCIFKPPLTRK